MCFCIGGVSDHLVSGDGADMSPGHLPSHAERGAVDGLQLDV